MIKYRVGKDICFDDILLTPQFSDVTSRKDVDLTMHEFKFPIVSSPMDTVTEWQMAAAIADEGGLGIIHRYMNTSERLIMLQMAMDDTDNPEGIGIAISSFESLETQFIEDAIKLGCKWFCIDTANGHGAAAVMAVKSFKNRYPNIKLMVGNVATGEGFDFLAEMGADAIRVGIGGGATCKTRIVTGHGSPTLQSIIDCYETKKAKSHSSLIVADGGIRNSGDIVKSFAAGADLVMLGSMLSGTEESPGIIMDGYKSLRGMASRDAQIQWRGEVSVDEGISTMVKYKGYVKDIFDEIRGGISSGCSYSGVHALADLCETAFYTEVSPLSINESRPHAEVNNA